jgi:hypothetical protein
MLRAEVIAPMEIPFVGDDARGDRAGFGVCTGGWPETYEGWRRLAWTMGREVTE